MIPAFLDFLHSFGYQEFPRDFYLSGFRQENFFENRIQTGIIQNLGRSGQEFQLCYNLRSVEAVSTPQKWSIRQTATVCSFDIFNGRTTWIVLKAKRNIRKRIKAASQSPRSSDFLELDTLEGAFGALLATHTIICEWARESWARYINFLEDNLQQKTRHAGLARVNSTNAVHSSTTRRFQRSETAPAQQLQRQNTEWSNWNQSSRSTMTRLGRAITFRPDIPTINESASMRMSESLPALPTAEPMHDGFTYDDLQRVQDIEGQANEALLVVMSNVSIMTELRSFFLSFLTSQHFPDALKNSDRDLIPRFCARISSSINDLKLQQSRAETLLRLLADRKSMVSGTNPCHHVYR